MRLISEPDYRLQFPLLHVELLHVVQEGLSPRPATSQLHLILLFALGRDSQLLFLVHLFQTINGFTEVYKTSLCSVFSFQANPGQASYSPWENQSVL